MDIETLIVMNEGSYPSLLTMLEAVALITGIFAIAGLAISLSGIAWLCFEETRRPARRQPKPMPEPPEPDEYDLLAVLTALDDGLSGNLGGGVTRPTDDVRAELPLRQREQSILFPAERRRPLSAAWIGKKVNETLQDKQ
jgi:hypothetical protein